MHDDLISIALPVFNNEKTVATTIRSVLKQSYKNWELIVVDDASTDNSLRVISSFKDKRIKLVRHKKNKHIAHTLNDIIKLAKGKYFARIDGDDYCYPDRLKIQLGYMKQNPKVDLVGSNLLVVDKFGRLLGKRSFRNVTSNPYAHIYIAHPSFFGKTSFFRKYRYHCPPVTAQDQDLLLRAYEKSNFATIDKILVCYQETLNIRKITRARFDLLKSRYLYKGLNFALLWLLINQLAKVSVDAFAIILGLDYRILKHRAYKISKAEKTEWLRVKKMLKVD